MLSEMVIAVGINLSDTGSNLSQEQRKTPLSLLNVCEAPSAICASVPGMSRSSITDDLDLC